MQGLPPGIRSGDAVAGCLRLTIRHEDRAPLSAAFSGRVELGRADPTRPTPDAFLKAVEIEGGGMRIPIAEPRESEVSRRQALLEASPGNRVRLTNLSTAIAIRCFGLADVAPGGSVEHPLPVSFQIGRVLVSVAVDSPAEEAAGAADGGPLQTLELPPDLPPAAGSASSLGKTRQQRIGEVILDAKGADLQGLVRWWREVIAVLQSASNSTDFFHKAAAAIVDLVGLDMGAVFLRADGGWKPAAISSSERSKARPSTNVLARVLAEKRTFWNKVDQNVDVFSSLAILEAYVAAPILDRDGEVLGALYGHREGGAAGRSEITQLEALLVETLACGVAAGLSRLEQEKATLQQKVQFEQFFSPQLAARLEVEPDLLRGRDAEVTVLFCDIREFSAVSERIGAARTMEWISGVLNPLSDAVVEGGGVLVDYVGDELMAMWGAPSAQPDHAALACRTAERMVAAIPRINEQWGGVIGGPTRFGIGINSATARVGNTGSTRKFKYGPLGNGVNLASRVQGATKYLRVSSIITGSTRRLLDTSFLVRRLCTVQVVNIAEPVELFELDCGDAPRRDELFPRYDESLAAFEAGNFSKAARLLGGVLDGFPGDGPSLVLLSRAVDAMVHEPAEFSVVWRLPGK